MIRLTKIYLVTGLQANGLRYTYLSKSKREACKLKTRLIRHLTFVRSSISIKKVDVPSHKKDFIKFFNDQVDLNASIALQ